MVNAGFTETVPKGIFIIDESISYSILNSRYDDNGVKTTLIDKVELYEPGAGLQGTLTPNAEVNVMLLINQVQYGLLDYLTLGVAVPVFFYSSIDLDLQWTPGDYQTSIGRAYSEDDFWAWAESMGQPRPGDWRGNQGKLADIILGLRYRFSDHVPWFSENGLGIALNFMGALPTGSEADPEEVASIGTNMWDLHSQGELAFHLSADWSVPHTDNRVKICSDFFYEFMVKRKYTTSTGVKNPLLLNFEGFVGDHYYIDPGDFAGVAVQLDLVPWVGPAFGSWLTKGDKAKAEKFPPLITISLQYRYINLGQSDWISDSAIWDWEKEKLWMPGYKNQLWGKLNISLLRLGVPLQVYVAYRNLSWIPGKNSRTADVISGGIVIPAQFW
jgi:hypothetical protein